MKEKDLIIVITAPNVHNQNAQEGWSQFLEPASRSPGVTLVFLEDLDSSSFKDRARKGMKDGSKPGQEPILLIDSQGEIRKKFKAPANETLVLVYKKPGSLVHVETQEPSKERARLIWQSLGVSQ